jgi:ParB family chromosome partitioning protein
MAKRMALGRGLEAYFPNLNKEERSVEADTPETSKEFNSDSSKTSTSHFEGIPDPKSRVNTIARIPVKDIKTNPYQPRTNFDEQELNELAASIAEHGIIQPLTLRYLGENRFELISGERRLRASIIAGLSDVPGYIIDADNEQMMAIALIENIQRSDLNPLEVALGYKRLIEECRYTQEELAAKVGKNRSTVTNMLRLLNLPAVIQQALITTELSMGHARALVALSEQSTQLKAATKIIKEGLNVRQTELLVKKLQTEKSKNTVSDLLKTTSSSDPFITDLTNKLRDRLSTQVAIKKKAIGGELRINYSSNDELQRLIELMGL